MPIDVEGKYYDIPNIGKIRLYPISKLSQELTDAGVPRDTQTIRKWEDKGIIPRPLFRVGQKRLYTKDQIDTIVKVAVQCNLRQGASIADTDFIDLVWKELEKVNAKYISKLQGGKKSE